MKIHYSLALPILLFLGLCAGCAPAEVTDTITVDDCGTPPVEFNKTDLTGTWKSGTSENSDTLILNANGTYKQIIHTETPAYDYESGWQTWTVEYSEAGRPYVHLEGMRLCIYEGLENCALERENRIDWYDFCKNEWISTPGEGVLIVLQDPEGFVESRRGFNLFALQIRTEAVTGYEFLDE